jgi:hypothetical protein
MKTPARIKVFAVLAAILSCPTFSARLAGAALEMDEKGDFFSDATMLSFAADGLPKALDHCGRQLLGDVAFKLALPGGEEVKAKLPTSVKRVGKEGVSAYSETFKVDGHTVSYQLTARQAGPNAVALSVEFDSSSLRFLELIIRLPPSEFVGKTFAADGKRGKYPSWPGKTLVPLAPVQEFLVATEKGHDLKIAPGAGTKLTVRDARQWQIEAFAIAILPDDGKRVDVTLTMPTDTGKRLGTEFPEGRNLIDNGGFEVGMSGWGVQFHGFDDRSRWSFDKAVHAGGRQSLRLDLAPSENLFAPPRPWATLTTDFMRVRANVPMMFSIALKADRPVDGVLRLHYLGTEHVHNRGDLVLQERIRIGTNSKRFSYSQRLPIALNDAYSVSLRVESPDGKPLTVWADDAQFNRGAGTDFEPFAEVEIGGDAPRSGNLYEPGDDVPIDITLRNNGSRARDLTLSCHVLGPGYQRVAHHEAEANVAGGATFEKTFTVKPERRGAYRVYLRASDAGVVVAHRGFSFGALEKRDVAKPDPTSFFGANGGTGSFKSLELMERVGFTYSRFSGFPSRWPQFEPEQGEWETGVEKRGDAVLDLYGKYGVLPIPTRRGIPAWAADAPENSSQKTLHPPKPQHYADLEAYAKRFAERFGSRFVNYEIWNEPNHSGAFLGNATDYAKILMAISKGLKAGDPDAFVVGFALTALKKGAQEFLETGLQMGALEHCDAISWHPYRQGRLGPEETDLRAELKLMRDVIGKYGEVPELWSTEFGWFAPHKFSKPFTPFKNHKIPKRLVSEEEAARYYVQQVATCRSYGVTKQFYFTFQEGSMAGRWMHGMIGPCEAFPEAHYFAAAAAVRHLDYAECLGQEKVVADLWRTRFRKNGKEFFLLWKAKGAIDLEIVTDEAIALEDLYGNPFTLTPHGGKVWLTVTEDPVYVLCPAGRAKIASADFIMPKKVRPAAPAPGQTAMLAVGQTPLSNLGGRVQAGFLESPLKVDSEQNLKQLQLPVSADAVIGEDYSVVLWLGDAESPSGRLERQVTVKR